MKELIELNERLLAVGKDQLPEDGLMLELRHEVNALRAELNRRVPDDFSYMLYLRESEPYFNIEYNNGPTTTYSPQQNWKAADSLFGQLERYDWDRMRAHCVSQSEIFDHIIALAKDLPVMIPRTKELQKACRAEMKEFIKEKRRDASKVHVLFAAGEELQSEEFEQWTEFVRRLPDLMTLFCQVVTVVAAGKPIPVDRIDGLKRTALKKLEDMPISHSKASGKFQLIMKNV